MPVASSPCGDRRVRRSQALRHLARHVPLKPKLHTCLFARADVEAHPRRAFEMQTEHRAGR